MCCIFCWISGSNSHLANGRLRRADVPRSLQCRGWTFDILAGRSKSWLDARNTSGTFKIGWTFQILTGYSEKSKMNSGAWGPKTGFQNVLLRQDHVSNVHIHILGSKNCKICLNIAKKGKNRYSRFLILPEWFRKLSESEFA